MQSMTPKEKTAAILAALDNVRRLLEETGPCGDADIDDLAAGLVDEIEGQIGAFSSYNIECV